MVNQEQKRAQAIQVIGVLAQAAGKFVQEYENGPVGETTSQAVERATNVALLYAFDLVDKIMTESRD